MVSLAKRILIGRPIASSEEGHQRLKKRIALPIFASDAVSSTAYATDEVILAHRPGRHRHQPPSPSWCRWPSWWPPWS